MEFISLFVLSQILLLPLAHSKTFRFTNVECKSLDPSFVEFQRCDLKVVRRGVVALNIHAVPFKTPVNEMSTQVSLFKKSNVYRPFLVNYTLDFCHYLRNRQSYPLANIFHNIYIDRSNVNHTCPYEGDIIIDGLVLDQKSMKELPLPNADFMIKIRVGAYHVWRADIKIYMTQNE